MFKIQNFLNRTRYFFNKIQIPKNKPRYQSSFRPSFTRFIILLPSTCMFSINLLSKQQIKFETRNSIEPRLEKIAEKKDLEELLVRIATEIKEENFEDARTYTEEGLQISEQNNFNELLPYFYDALIIITLREGNDTVAEEILVRSIEKLTEIGYKDTDNEIVRFQLMLARLYQKKGNSDMAGLGFRNCISIQETKHNTVMDETSTSLYVNVLFWYSIFLNEENELTDSKNYMTKALELSKSTQTEPAQTLVILYNLAELSFRLKELDDAIKYLADGLRLCLQNLSIDSALPVFMVKLGLVYLVKGMHEAAEYWCSIARIFARSSHNACVENEASMCLKYLQKDKASDK